MRTARGEWSRSWSTIERAERIYQNNRAFMLRLAQSMVRPDDAEDVVQNAALTMVRGKAEVGEHVSERGYCAYMVKASRGMYARSETSRRRMFCSLEEKLSEDEANGHHDRLLSSKRSAEDEAMGRMELKDAAGRAPVEARLVAAGYTLRETSEMLAQTIDTTWGRVAKWRAQR